VRLKEHELGCLQPIELANIDLKVLSYPQG
jgi:hypothetical protein